MSSQQEIMIFRYRALFQSLDIRLFNSSSADSFTTHCEAEIKLPILKKTYRTASEFANNYSEWLRHAPVREKAAEERWVSKNKDNEQALDPIGFFMMFDQHMWSEPHVQLLIGAKVIKLTVEKISDGFEISRPEKEQKLRIVTSSRGIEKLEIPLPIIGTVSVDRVWG